jgi:hypothetical protein
MIGAAGRNRRRHSCSDHDKEPSNVFEQDRQIPGPECHDPEKHRDADDDGKAEVDASGRQAVAVSVASHDIDPGIKAPPPQIDIDDDGEDDEGVAEADRRVPRKMVDKHKNSMKDSGKKEPDSFQIVHRNRCAPPLYKLSSLGWLGFLGSGKGVAGKSPAEGVGNAAGFDDVKHPDCVRNDDTDPVCDDYRRCESLQHGLEGLPGYETDY